MRLRCVVLSVLVACGGSGADPDAGHEDGAVDAGASACRSDTDCSDGLFCNGAERCAPDEATADARGCVGGTAPCTGDAICDEATRTCDGECPDADGDGYADAQCGGDDCDDTSPEIHPGAVEVCDPEHVDEDCDPSTVAGAEGDVDMDGFVSDACCNVQPSGMLRCGEDCDDRDASIRPGAQDICDGIDNDCDGRTDENPNELYYRDRDGDSYGVTEMSVVACSAPPGYSVLPGDCDDANANIHPAATERCDGIDNNCNELVDEGCPCVRGDGTTALTGDSRVCDTERAGVGICRAGTELCTEMGWATCIGSTVPAEEVCNGLDDDCDGDVDEGCACTPGAVDDRCGTTAGICTLGTRTCELVGGTAAWSMCTGVAPSTESCNHLDDDCDGRIDEGRGQANCTRAYHSMDGLHTCAPTACCASCPTFGGAITSLISISDRDASRGIFVNLGSSPLDWGRAEFSVEARAEIVVPCSSTASGPVCKYPPRTQSWSVVVAPGRNVSENTDDHGLAATPAGQRGYAASLVFDNTSNPFGVRAPTLKIFQLSASGPIEVASAPVGCGANYLFPVRLTLRSAAGPGANSVRITASVSIDGRRPTGDRPDGCPAEASVSYDDLQWRTMLYGERADFPRYQVGSVARVEGANCTTGGTPPNEHCTRIDLLDMTLSRGGRAQEGHCVGCPP